MADTADAIAEMTQLYNDGRVDELVDRFFAPDARLRHVTRDIDVTGREALRRLFRETLERWPDRRTEIVRCHPAGDTVVVERRWEATEHGEPLVLEQCYVYEFENGQIVRQRQYG